MVELHIIPFLPILLYWNPTFSSPSLSPEPPPTQRGERMRPLLLDLPTALFPGHPLASSHVRLELWTSRPLGRSTK